MTLCDGHAMVGAGELIAVTMIAVVAHSGPLYSRPPLYPHCHQVYTLISCRGLHTVCCHPHSLSTASLFAQRREERPASCQDLSGDSLDTGSDVDGRYPASSSRCCLVTPDLLNVGSEEAAVTTSGSLQVSAV